MKELEFRPVAAFRLDDDSPFTDYSGFERTATRTGTEVKGIPLTSTASYSQSLSDTRVASFTIPGFIQRGNEDQSYSVSMTVYAIGDFSFAHDTAPVWFGRNNGVWQMAMAYSDNSTIETDGYTPEVNQKYNIVATYSRTSLVLFLNNERVIEYKIPDESQDLEWQPITDVWEIGGDVLVDNVCFYSDALSGDQIKKIHQYNSRHGIEDVPAAFGGQTVHVSTKVRKPSMEIVWDSEAEWKSGVHEQTVVDGTQLQAQRQENLTVDGKWSNSITFTSPVALSTFQSAYIIWDGKNVEIEVSLDDITWITPIYGESLSIIPTGFDPNGETLLVRVNFEEGSDEAYLNRLVFRAFTGPDSNSHIDERIITYTNPAFTWDEQEPNDMIDFWGVRLEGGTVEISPDPNMSAKTVEVWFKLDGPSTDVMNFTDPPDSTYVNGILNGTLVLNQWVVAHYIYNSAFSEGFSIDGTLTVGRVAVYPDALTQDQVTRIIQSYTGYPKSRVDDGAVITIGEPTTPATIYDLEWSNLVATP